MMQIGRIGYINCYPVYGAIDRGLVDVPGELVTGTPSELNGLLAAGELDVSVISAVEYARDARAYQLLPGLAVSCDGPVRSVALFARRPVEELDGATVLISESSRTSVLLLELLCADVWRISPRFVSARTEASDLASLERLPHDGVLVIGDAALLLAARSVYAYRYDLGEEWKQWTGLPFVFAVWAARRTESQGGSARRPIHAEPAPTFTDLVVSVHESLLASRDWGIEHLDLLADEASTNTGIDTRQCREYLSGLDYALSYRHLEGLTSFFRRLVARGKVKEGTLSFLSVA